MIKESLSLGGIAVAWFLIYCLIMMVILGLGIHGDTDNAMAIAAIITFFLWGDDALNSIKSIGSLGLHVANEHNKNKLL